MGRLLLLAFVALGLSPGTWLRTPVELGLDIPVTLHAVDEPGAEPPEGWSLEGVWEFRGDGLLFGGYSALFALDDGRLEAFSDRRGRFTFLQPDQPQGSQPTAQRQLSQQEVEAEHRPALHDIEAATRDPETGRYWLAFEGMHSFQRYGPSNAVDGLRIIHDEVEWPGNAGAEAFVRLNDGRFLAVNESGEEALLYPEDPVSGVLPLPVTYEAAPEIADFSVTDAVQLPDGRLLMLLRRVAWGIPPFEARLAIADWPAEGSEEAGQLVLAPESVLDLTAIAPPDNYEGLALREREDGALDVWVIDDDNLSIMQRTLLVKPRFDSHRLVSPAMTEPRALKKDADKPSAKQKARR